MNRGDESQLLEQVCDAIRASPYTVDQIAERAKVSSAILYAWLYGRVAGPRITTLEKVADALDYSIVLKRGAAVLVKTLPAKKAEKPQTVRAPLQPVFGRRPAIPPLAEWLRQ